MYFKNLFIRNIDAVNLIEAFMVSAITSILAIRFYLYMTGYPQIGGHGLHIAHMLFGGFFMMTALVCLFSFISRRIYLFAAILGGIGFGTFIDELGKFVTSDNNYFFEPTVALIYMIFIILYLATHAVEKHRKFTKTEYLANAIEMMKEAVIHDLNKDEKHEAMSYLRRSDKDHPLVQSFHKLLEEIEVVPKGPPNMFDRIEDFFKNMYKKLVGFPLFYRGIVLFFVAQSFISLMQSIALINTVMVVIVSIISGIILVIGLARANLRSFSKLQVGLIVGVISLLLFYFSGSIQGLSERSLNIIELGELLSSTGSVILVVLGIYSLNKSRLQAFIYFRYSVLLSIFITQFFVFYKIQFGALIGFTINILTLLVLEYMISREEAIEKSQ